MVQPKYVPSAELNMGEATALISCAEALSEARRAWAEAFLRFKIGGRGSLKITDNVAKAQADIEVNVTLAEVNWELAKLGIFDAAQS